MTEKRPKIGEVFTPRSAVVNSSMYIDRPRHETDLRRAVDGTQHAIVCGESGSGKSWLYRHVGAASGWEIFLANAGNASRCGSLTETIAQGILEDGEVELRGYSSQVEGGVAIPGLKGGASAERTYDVRQGESLLRAFKEARVKAGERTAVVVVDNLEAIYGDSALMDELGNIILLLDDPDYAQYRVKLLIVGVPLDVVEYFRRLKNLEPVSNRLREVPSIQAMGLDQIREFVRRGFVEQLRVDLDQVQIETIAAHVHRVTLGIAQRIHEYCEHLAYEIEEKGWHFEAEVIPKADAQYLLTSLRRAHSVVEGSMNERKTKAGRRNQVIYSLGKIRRIEFDAAEVEDVMRRAFPASTKDTTLAVGQTLAEMTGGDSPLLRRSAKGASYRFADPRYLMCIRILLRKTRDEKVERLPFKR